MYTTIPQKWSFWKPVLEYSFLLPFCYVPKAITSLKRMVDRHPGVTLIETNFSSDYSMALVSYPGLISEALISNSKITSFQLTQSPLNSDYREFGKQFQKERSLSFLGTSYRYRCTVSGTLNTTKFQRTVSSLVPELLHKLRGILRT